VYVGLELIADTANSRYHIRVYGMTAVIASATRMNEHVNVSDYSKVFLDNTAMPYWIVANGRRMAWANKVSTVYQSAYAGLLTPFALPTSYPYPLFIGGMASGDPDTIPDWRSTSAGHADYLHARYQTLNPTTASQARLLTPAGAWIEVISQSASNTDFPTGHAVTWPYGDQGIEGNAQTATSNFRPFRVLQFQKESFGGDFVLTPVILHARTPAEQVYGTLDGVSAVQGIGNSSENLVTIGDDDHVCIQNAFRTSGSDYYALRLE
jgi:hypothetical protein